MPSTKYSIILSIALICSFFACTQNTSEANDTNKSTINTPPKSEKRKPLDLNIVDYNKENLPYEVPYNGDFVLAKAWKDRNGDNFLVVSKEAPIAEKNPKEDGAQKATLYVVQFAKLDQGYTLVWDIRDLVRQCPFDVLIEVLTDGISITDLDNNHLTETTISYQKTCTSDVSPNEMSILLLEDNKKYGLHGYRAIQINAQSKLDFNDFEYDLSKAIINENEAFAGMGRYRNTSDFAGAPPSFLIHAQKQWKKHVLQSPF